jgi:hypothetical protein
MRKGFPYRGVYGVNYRVKERITVADLAFRVHDAIKTEVDVTLAQLTRNGIDLIHGTASFLDSNRMQVENARGRFEYSADVIVLATGTRPATSLKVPLNGRTVVNSDQILEMPEILRTLIIVGGGVIGAEYTSMFAALGVRVILVERRARLLEFADAEIIETLSYHPEGVFMKAAGGDTHYAEFVKLWHRALAADCAATIHLDGPGKFFLTGPNARFLDLNRPNRYVDKMVTMSSLQGSSFEVMQTGDEIGALGAAVDAHIAIAESSALKEDDRKAASGQLPASALTSSKVFGRFIA